MSGVPRRARRQKEIAHPPLTLPGEPCYCTWASQKPDKEGSTMTQKDYKILAEAMGEALARGFATGGHEARTLVYNSAYGPLVDRLESDNPRFDRVRFAHAVATAEREGC